MLDQIGDIGNLIKYSRPYFSIDSTEVGLPADILVYDD